MNAASEKRHNVKRTRRTLTPFATRLRKAITAGRNAELLTEVDVTVLHCRAQEVELIELSGEEASATRKELRSAIRRIERRLTGLAPRHQLSTLELPGVRALHVATRAFMLEVTARIMDLEFEIDEDGSYWVYLTDDNLERRYVQVRLAGNEALYACMARLRAELLGRLAQVT